MARKSSHLVTVNLTLMAGFLLALVEPSRQQLDNTTFNFLPLAQQDPDALLPCMGDYIHQVSRDKLDQNCHLLWLFNQTEVDHMDDHQLRNTSLECACQLAAMGPLWIDAFDGSDLRRLSTIVDRTIRRDNQTLKHPDYFWSDLDVTVKGVSIYTAYKDFLSKKRNSSLALSPSLKRSLERDPIWSVIKRVCSRVAKDKFKLYRYMENLVRLEPTAFIRLINVNPIIGTVYQASKACKFPLMLHLNEYKMRPDDANLVRVDNNPSQAPVWDQALRESENLVSNDIDLMLKDASAQLLNCKGWQGENSASIEDLGKQCPMMLGEQVVAQWLVDHPSPQERSQIAIECGCKLLLHNSTWAIIMGDPNVQIMSKSLTDYMNRNRVPDFANTPIWSIYSWFKEIMSKFIKNRKMSVKEVIKAKLGDQDPLTAINNKSDDYSRALELLRRGCNFIMFNYRKGSKEASELRLVHYLDNLQLISRDPMFVFHLTLQDPDLFKLHALSKMCEPIVK